MAEHFIARLLPILSNLPFLAASSRALEYGLGFQTLLWALVALFTSPSYHLCQGFGACLWSVSKHRVVDFWSAEMALPVVATDFIDFRAAYARKWFLLMSIVAIGLLVTGTDSSFMNQAVIGGVSGLIVICYLIWFRAAHGYWPDYDLVQLVLGIGFLALGVCFFVVQEWWPPYYNYNHSYWHACIGVGVYFAIGILPPKEQTLNLDSRIVSVARVINDAMPGPAPRWLSKFRVPRSPV
jgi:hypothetical protein